MTPKKNTVKNDSESNGQNLGDVLAEAATDEQNLGNKLKEAATDAVIQDIFGGILDDIKADALQKPVTAPQVETHKEPVTINDRIQEQYVLREGIANDRLQAENENLRNDQQLKENTLKLLFIFLGAETMIIFAITILQGFHTLNFDLDDVTLRIVVVASLAQISTMLTIAVRHLFPQMKKEKKPNKSS